jgi:hypothetical protein
MLAVPILNKHSMFFIIYSSYAAVEFDDGKLKFLLIQSRERNKEMGITGMLLYFDGTFIQLIEGEEDEVKLLYKDICNDLRHRNVITLKEGPMEGRHFDNWSMGFKSLQHEELIAIEGYQSLQMPTENNFPAILNLLKLISSEDHSF